MSLVFRLRTPNLKIVWIPLVLAYCPRDFASELIVRGNNTMEESIELHPKFELLDEVVHNPNRDNCSWRMHICRPQA